MNKETFQFQTIEERRSFPRTEVLAYIKVIPPDTTPIYYVEDISENGAYLVAHRKPAVGKEMRITISVRLMPRDIEILCQVIRHEDRGFAVQFNEMHEQDRELLSGYLYADPSRKIRAKYLQSSVDP